MDAQLLLRTLRAARCARGPNSRIANLSNPFFVGSNLLQTILISLSSYGGSRIRTHGARKGTTVFKTAAFDRSAIPPAKWNCSRGPSGCQFAGGDEYQDFPDR